MNNKCYNGVKRETELANHFCRDMIIMLEWHQYHISPDFYAPFVAAGAAMS